jgi:hypothetical protein
MECKEINMPLTKKELEQICSEVHQETGKDPYDILKKYLDDTEIKETETEILDDESVYHF